MRKIELKRSTGIAKYVVQEGETIEMKVERVMSNNEPIDDTAPIIYTDRREGVLPQYDPRTDKFDLSLDAMGAVTRTQIAKRIEFYAPKKSAETESTQDTDVK